MLWWIMTLLVVLKKTWLTSAAPLYSSPCTTSADTGEQGSNSETKVMCQAPAASSVLSVFCSPSYVSFSPASPSTSSCVIMTELTTLSQIKQIQIRWRWVKEGLSIIKSLYWRDVKKLSPFYTPLDGADVPDLYFLYCCALAFKACGQTEAHTGLQKLGSFRVESWISLTVIV